MKNRPLIMIEPQAHKKFDPSLSVSQTFSSRVPLEDFALFAYLLHLENLIAQNYTVAMFLLNKHQPRVEKN